MLSWIQDQLPYTCPRVSSQIVIHTKNTLSKKRYPADITISIPTDLASTLNSQYNLPATLVSGSYVVACNATPPAVAITIAGVNLILTVEDLILQGTSDGNGSCDTRVQDGAGFNILGDTFMNNVLTTFDLGAMEMRFTALA